MTKILYATHKPNPYTKRSTEDSRFKIRRASWSGEREALARIRQRVFVQEQGVPPALEWDGLDQGALHLLAESAAGEPIGTARLLADGHIGRMAVLPEWRHHGVGSALLRELLRITRERTGCHPFLDAQSRAVEFYRRHGFLAEGEEFLDAGIPHRHMTLPPPQPEP